MYSSDSQTKINIEGQLCVLRKHVEENDIIIIDT